MKFFQVYIVMGLENAPSVSRTYKSYLTMWKTSIFPILPHALCVGKYFLQLTKWGIIEAQVIDKEVTILHIDLNTSLFLYASLLMEINHSLSLYFVPGTLVMSQLPTVGGGVCPVCSKSIVTNLKRHMEDIHYPGEFPCPHCGKIFSSKNKLASHVSQTCRERKKNVMNDQRYWLFKANHECLFL